MNTPQPSPFCLIRPLALASASPRRRAFLHELGLACRIVQPPDEAEPTPCIGEDPAIFVDRAASAKADAVLAMLGEGWAVLGADTVVCLDGAILGKPANIAEAAEFLKRLAGKTHCVRTACRLLLGEESISFFGEAHVRMGQYDAKVLEAYAATGEGLDKAGAYAVQGIGAFLVESVKGSWSSVVGLPVAETVRVLLQYGIIAPASSL